MTLTSEWPQSLCICGGFRPANEATASETTTLFKASSWASVFIRHTFIGQIKEKRVFLSENPVPSVSSIQNDILLLFTSTRALHESTYRVQLYPAGSPWPCQGYRLVWFTLIKQVFLFHDLILIVTYSGEVSRVTAWVLGNSLRKDKNSSVNCICKYVN